MARTRNHARRDLPPNLYVRNGGYYCYRDPRTGKEYGLGRDKRLAVTEAIAANMAFLVVKRLSRWHSACRMKTTSRCTPGSIDTTK